MSEKKKMVSREASLLAGGIKVACYRVFDPEADEYGPRQFHMTYGNTVMAVMGEEAAKLFSRFVNDTLSDHTEESNE